MHSLTSCSDSARPSGLLRGALRRCCHSWCLHGVCWAGRKAALLVLLQTPAFSVGHIALSVGVSVCGALKRAGLVITDAAGVPELAGVA
jgi:hypothetical protein